MRETDTDGYVACSVCGSLYSYSGTEPDGEFVKRHCDGHGRDDFTLGERISYALYWGRKREREYQKKLQNA